MAENTSSNKFEGTFVELKPISSDHFEGLQKHYTKELSQFFPRPFDSVFDKCFGPSELFTVIDKKSSLPIGCTGYFYKDNANRKVQIGGSWIGQTFQGTPANSESKLLLIKYAFEELHCIRVEFTTGLHNQRSQAALEKLGAKREGVLRNHIVLPSGQARDTVYYSIIVEEWPEAYKTITERINKKAGK